MRRCLALLAALSAGALTGTAASLYLVGHSPLLLIALSPMWRHMILVAPTVHPLAFLVVAIARPLLFATICYILGRTLRGVTHDWLKSRMPWIDRIYSWIERMFNRAPIPALLLLPGAGMSIVAGSAGMRPTLYLPVAALGTALRALALLGFGEWLRAPIEALLVLVDEYWIPGTVLIVAALLLHRVLRRPTDESL